MWSYGNTVINISSTVLIIKIGDIIRLVNASRTVQKEWWFNIGDWSEPHIAHGDLILVKGIKKSAEYNAERVKLFAVCIHLIQSSTQLGPLAVAPPPHAHCWPLEIRLPSRRWSVDMMINVAARTLLSTYKPSCCCGLSSSWLLVKCDAQMYVGWGRITQQNHMYFWSMRIHTYPCFTNGVSRMRIHVSQMAYHVSGNLESTPHVLTRAEVSKHV